jgi:hypothetical protein
MNICKVPHGYQGRKMMQIILKIEFMQLASISFFEMPHDLRLISIPLITVRKISYAPL